MTPNAPDKKAGFTSVDEGTQSPAGRFGVHSEYQADGFAASKAFLPFIPQLGLLLSVFFFPVLSSVRKPGFSE